MDIPQDADGDAIRRVFSHGSDPSLPMDVDFMIACPDDDAAERIAMSVKEMGYITAIRNDQEDDLITCYCTKRMILMHETLVASQEELDSAAGPHGGYSDGWGTFGNLREAQ